jgi:peptide/nickel transport system substrate-binding protein
MDNYGVGENLFYAPDLAHLTEPWLAESYEMAPDLSYAIIRLRKDVVFHKGFGPMTADDVVYTLNDANAGVNPASIHGQAGDYAPIFNAWEKIDDYTVKAPFKMFDPRWAANFLNHSCQGTTIFSKKVLDTKGADWMRENIISTGPYQVVEWIRSDRIVLEAVPYKHWAITPAVKNQRFIQVPEESTRIAMLKTGEVDNSQVSIRFIKALREEGFATTGADKITGSQIGVFYPGNNWETKHALTGATLDNAAVYMREYAWTGNPADAKDMEDARLVRWALALAIDRDAINEAIFGGLGWAEYLEYCQAKSPYFDKKWELKYDLNAAKEMLKKTKTPNGFEIPLFGRGDVAPYPELADAVSGFWMKLGPSMSVPVLKYAYAIYRPGVVARTTTIPWVETCDEGKTLWPFDWPKGMVITSLTRGGFSAGFEVPEVAAAFLKNTKEPDINKRIETNKGVCDVLWNWQLGTGIVAAPTIYVFNPKSIKEWPMSLSLWGDIANDAFRIVPTAR